MTSPRAAAAPFRSRRAIASGTLYFALVFAVGFLLGAMRVTFLVPRLGERWAELLEMPLMGVAIWVAARVVVRRYALPAAPGIRWSTGVAGLALLVAAELGLVLVLQEHTLVDYISSRDPVSGSVYICMLVFFTAAPWLLTRVRKQFPRTRFNGD